MKGLAARKTICADLHLQHQHAAQLIPIKKSGLENPVYAVAFQFPQKTREQNRGNSHPAQKRDFKNHRRPKRDPLSRPCKSACN
jgi:hypothetical protein